MRVFNSLHKVKEDFRPLVPKRVSMYVCGVTVYDECHLGHARAYVFFDVLRRYLTFCGYDVAYVQNFTDIDDKIIARAGEKNISAKDLAEHFIERYFAVMDALGIQRAGAYPKATEHIDQMIRMIEVLIQKGAAYAAGGDVFFEVAKFSSYGKLSGKDLESLRAGERVDVDARKRSPLDFVLWKAAKPGEPSWPSPWGEGRPGWHIECSAMSLEHFGGTFDIHGGGCDLIFPHHENEIAQSEAATGHAFANYWLHNGFLTINKEKMSKSLGNFFVLKDIMELYAPEVVRFFLLTAHYRSPIEFADERLKEAQEQLHRGYTMLKHVGLRLQRNGGEETIVSERVAEIRTKFLAGMDDDCNTAVAIACLFDLVYEANCLLEKKGEDNDAQLKGLVQVFQELAHILFVFQNPPVVVTENGAAAVGVEARVQSLLRQRTEARKAKQWAAADGLRGQLLAMFADMEIEDTPQGSLATFRAISRYEKK